MPTPAASTPNRPAWQWRVVIAGIVVAAIATGWAITGPAPRSSKASSRDDAARPSSPPFILRDDEPASSDFGRATGLLRADRRAAAEDAFRSIARSSTGVERARALIGVEIARWQQDDPEPSLEQVLEAARPAIQNASVLLQVGIAQVVAGDGDAGRVTLRRARDAAASSASSEWDAYRHAEDLLHPDLASGYPPLVVAPGDAATSEGRELIRKLAAFVQAGDRPAALRLASSARAVALASTDPAVAAAVAGAAYDKDRPSRQELALRSARMPISEATPAQLQRSVILLWNGRRDEAQGVLRMVARRPATTAAERRWQSLARELLRRL